MRDPDEPFSSLEAEEAWQRANARRRTAWERTGSQNDMTSPIEAARKGDLTRLSDHLFGRHLSRREADEIARLVGMTGRRRGRPLFIRERRVAAEIESIEWHARHVTDAAWIKRFAKDRYTMTLRACEHVLGVAEEATEAHDFVEKVETFLKNKRKPRRPSRRSAFANASAKVRRLAQVE